MSMRRVLGPCLILLLAAGSAAGAGSEVADAAMKQNREAVRSLLQRTANVHAPQGDGTTALHWAVRVDDLEMTDLLLRAGAAVTAANRQGVTPMQLAALNGSAAMLDRLLKAGADANAPLTPSRDTAVMLAARTGKEDAPRVLLEAGARVNDRETWGGTTALMWAVAERHPAAVKLLIDNGVDVNARSHFVPAANGRGFERRTPVTAPAGQQVDEFASGWMTPLMFAAREGDLELVRLLLSYGADPTVVSSDGEPMISAAAGPGFIQGYRTGGLEVEDKR